MARGEGMLRLPSHASSPLLSTASGFDAPATTSTKPGHQTLRRTSIRAALLVLATIAIIFGFFGTSGVQDLASGSQPILSYVTGKGAGFFSSANSIPLYKASAEALPPSLSSLPDSLKRITLIAIWSSDDRPQYFNNFFRSAAFNADVADLVFIHISSDKSKCLDGRHPEGRDDGIHRDAAWEWEQGGNIRIVCISREADLVEKANWLCSKGGWNCDAETYRRVHQRLQDREDTINVDWKPMLGEVYRRYFLHLENPLWAWVDADEHLGDLRHIPFSLLSTVNFLAPAVFSPKLLFLPGQMTFFNLAAPGSVGAWRNYKPLQTAEAFINPADAADGGYAGNRGADESYLSAMMLRDEPGYAGQGLNWAFVSDLHGQDIFMPGRKFVVSGRHTLEVDAELTREEIEAILEDAENEQPHEYSGWSSQGIVVPTEMIKGEACEAWFEASEAQCIRRSSLTVGDQLTRIDSVRRPTVMRIATDPQDQLQVRLEPDRRPRRWQKKLFLHYQEIKRQDWWQLPPWFIGDNDEVMEFDWKYQVIWRKGDKRETNLWERRNRNLDEDGNTITSEEEKAAFVPARRHRR